MNKQIMELLERIEYIAVDAKNKDGVINKLIQRIDNLEKNYVVMTDKSSVEVLNDRISQIENTIEVANKNVNFPALNWCTVATKAVQNGKNQATKVPEQQIEIINTIASEQLDRAKRKNRILVFGVTLPETQNEEEKAKYDKEKIIEILKIKKLRRMKVRFNI